MGLQENVRNSDLVFEIGTLATMTRILVGADVIPGPAVECAVAHAGNVVGRTLSPRPSRSLVEHHTVPLMGSIAMPTQLRIPVAYMRPF